MKNLFHSTDSQSFSRSAFSIAEFCQLHSISRTHFYQLEKTGKGPATMSLGRRVLISAEAAAEWRDRMSKQARV